MRLIRLEDIAQAAGVSRSSVSLALRNHPSLPPKTRARIRQVARRLGYRPNPLVAALMAYRRQSGPARPTHLSLAFIAPYKRSEPWQSYLSADLLSQAALSAQRQGYRLEQFWLGELGLESRQLSRMLFERGVPGVLIAPLPPAQKQLQLEWKHFSAVALGYSLTQPQLHRVSSDRFHGLLLALRQLRLKGYRRLGLAIDADQDARVHHQWAAAFDWEQKQQPAAQRTEPFLARKADWTPENFKTWFRANQPEVILGYDPGLMDWLKGLGKRVPQQVGFVHLWNPDRSGRYAGLYHDPPGLGSTAVEFLVAMIGRNERGLPASPQTLLLGPSWVEGASLEKRPQLRIEH